MIQLGEEAGAGGAEYLSCIFSSFLKLKWTLEVCGVIKLQPCLAAPLVTVWKMSVPSLCGHGIMFFFPNTDRQHPIDMLNVACGENTGALSLILY